MQFFGKDSKDVDWDNIEFEYVAFKPYVPLEEDSELWNPNLLGTFEWGAKGIGFGEVAMYRISDKEPNDVKFYFDAEHMSKRFLKQMFNHMVDYGVTDRDNPEQVFPEYHCDFKKIEDLDSSRQPSGNRH